MLDVRAKGVHDDMKLAAAHALAEIVSKNELSEEYIIPSMFDKRVAEAVAAATAEAAVKSGDGAPQAAARGERREERPVAIHLLFAPE